MSLSSRLGRLVAAAALVASGVVISTVATTVPSGAANHSVTLNCPDPDVSGQEIENGDTVTITVGTGCASVVLDINGAGGTLSVNGGPDLIAGNPAAVSQGDTVLFTAPASGSGSDFVRFLDGGQVPSSSYRISFPPSSGSMVDNGDGSMTLTYVGNVVVFLLPEGSTCASTLVPQDEIYILDGDPPVQFGGVGPSPAIISAGTEVMSGSGPGAVPIEAGIYEACMYYYGFGSGSPLQQALTVGLGEVVPTTTTTTAADDPVTPAYTG